MDFILTAVPQRKEARMSLVGGKHGEQGRRVTDVQKLLRRHEVELLENTAGLEVGL